MLEHLRANVWLLVLTLILCSILYPFALLLGGQTILRHQAHGSLIDEKGNPVTDSSQARGSLLIAQPFKGDEYFQPRLSNAGSGYDATSSGATNWGAPNPLLRSRVARQLGPIVKYASNSPTKPGQRVGDDIDAWFKAQVQQDPSYVAKWARENSTIAEQWVKDNLDAVALWLNQPGEVVKGDPAKASEAFFSRFVPKHPATWPSVEDQKVIKPIQQGPDVQAFFFDSWLLANRGAMQKGTIILEKVPSDLVMSSGSGLDPDITLKNALYQVERVAGKWAEKTGRDLAKVRQEIVALLHQKAHAPLGGLVGVDLVNVLEINLALRSRLLDPRSSWRNDQATPRRDDPEGGLHP